MRCSPAKKSVPKSASPEQFLFAPRHTNSRCSLASPHVSPLLCLRLIIEAAGPTVSSADRSRFSPMPRNTALIPASSTGFFALVVGNRTILSKKEYTQAARRGLRSGARHRSESNFGNSINGSDRETPSPIFKKQTHSTRHPYCTFNFGHASYPDLSTPVLASEMVSCLTKTPQTILRALLSREVRGDGGKGSDA